MQRGKNTLVAIGKEIVPMACVATISCICVGKEMEWDGDRRYRGYQKLYLIIYIGAWRLALVLLRQGL